MRCLLRDEVAAHFATDEAGFDQILALQGEVARDKDNRRTARVEIDGKPYYLKAHFGTGWKEIVKNLLRFRIPVVSAKNEWQAIERLQALGVDTMTVAGVGWRKRNPALQQSFLLTDALDNTVTLQQLCLAWRAAGVRPAWSFKRQLIARVAQIARRLHEAGVNHRDLYICHFRLPAEVAQAQDLADHPMYVMDLHRVGLRQQVTWRDQVKDLGALLFSSDDLPLTMTDKLYFIQHYHGMTPRQSLRQHWLLWLRVRARAQRFHRHEVKRSLKNHP